MAGSLTGSSSLTPGKTMKLARPVGVSQIRSRGGQMKAAGVTDALVETGKQLRKDLLDFVADPIVVVDKVVPIDAATGQRGFCHTADNRNLRFQLLTWRFD